jgi:hypothetical protein
LVKTGRALPRVRVESRFWIRQKEALARLVAVTERS